MQHELYRFDKEDAYRFARSVHAQIHEKGDELVFRYCPYCHGGDNHDQRTFAINLLTGAWNCKRGSCGRSGNMITLDQEFEEFSLGEGVHNYYLNKERYRKFAKRPIVVKDEAIEYLKSRGIPEEITRKYEVTMKKDAEHVMVFPFFDENSDLWFVKYRDIEFKKGTGKGNKEWCEKDRKQILFGMNHCNFDNDVLVITEGQIDSLSCAAAGIENAVSVPTGKNGFSWVPNCWNFLGRFNELIIFGDYENGSISLLDQMKTRFYGRIKHVREEDYKDCKDANEILVKYGPEAVRQCIENAELIPVPGIKRMVDIQRVDMSSLESMETGFAELDEKCRFYFGELIILTGAAGDGKSTEASQWATMALNQGYSTMIYSGEMPAWFVKNWIDMQIVGPANTRFNGRTYDITEEAYKKLEQWDMYQKLYIYDSNEDTSQDKLIETILKGIQQYGIRFLIIDNLMTAMDYEGEVELNNAQTAFTKRLANIAQERNVIIVLVVHPRKGNGSRAFSNDDIAGSSNIVNRAHKTIRYSRPAESFTDPTGRTWEKEELYDCPYRILTVLKDRLTGKTISKGILLDYDDASKRITDKKGHDRFNWRLNWDSSALGEAGFDPAEDDDIPF